MANRSESTEHMDILLSQLKEIKIDKSKLPERLQEVPIETQLSKLANISLDRETKNFEEIVLSIESSK